MVNAVDIVKELMVGEYQSFKEAVVNLAVNNPRLCFDFLSSWSDKMSEYKDQFMGLYGSSAKPYSPAEHIRPKALAGMTLEALEALSQAKEVAQFVKLCIRARTENDVLLNYMLDNLLRKRFGGESVFALRYLLNHADFPTLRDFAYACLPPDELVRNATVDIVVRRIESEGLMRGNTGRFLIYACKGDTSVRLKFTHQASAVFYLMHLIDHCTRDHGSDIVDLHRNKEPFTTLYQLVYDMSPDEVTKKYTGLLYREDAYGNIRAGRTAEVVYDIGKALGKAFESYDESYYPYCIRSGRHLTVGKERIHFADDAQELLGFRFC